ncbi:MAG TPA: hypothetical protein VH968_01795 [Gaiellaceae bacterium]|jgi:hypothetical protein
MRRASTAAFAVALLAFVLPFATVSCDELSVEPTGADLVLGSAPETEGPNPEGIALGELVVAYGGGLATAAFLAFALSLLALVRTWSSAWATLAGAVGVAALLFLKTRGSGGTDGVTEVDARLGGILAGAGGAAGALAAGTIWLRNEGRPSLRPLAPVAAAALILFGYLFPSERSPLLTVAYADTLDLRHPWDGVFWLLPVVVGIAFLALRRELSPRLSAFGVGILAVVAVDLADEIQQLVRDDNGQPGIAPIAFLAGVITAGLWAIASEWLQLRRPPLIPFGAGLALSIAAWLASPAS